LETAGTKGGILAKDEGAFDLILAELDATFRYNEDVEMPRAFEKFFYGTSRKPDQTLLSYVADHREALAKLRSMEFRSLTKSLDGSFCVAPG
jgi:hypothetical protein